MARDPDPYCNAVHPDYIEPREVDDYLKGHISIIDAPTVWCRRIKNHPGKHSAYTYLISQPETWST